MAKEGHPGAFNVKMSWGEATSLPVHTDGGMVEQGEVAVSYLSRLSHDERADMAVAEAGLDDFLQR